MKRALIIGISGQDGSYLAELLLQKGYEVHGTIRRASTFNTGRIDHLYQDPHVHGVHLFLHYSDLSDGSNLSRLIQEIKPDEVYNLGAQSHVRVSFDIPEYTGLVTALGTLKVLDAIREADVTTKFYQASSSEMYGLVQAVPQTETTPFYPRSPYAVAKLYAYWITKNYREAYTMFACNGILFNHECLTERTPVIIKKNGLLDVMAIADVVPHHENPRHGIKYSTLTPAGLEIWDGSQWTRVKTMTATWNKAGSKIDKKVTQVVCRGGYYEASYDHISFLKAKTEVKTGQLRPKDLLELGSLPVTEIQTTTTLEEAEWLGMMAADGYISAEGQGRFINTNKKLRARMRLLWQTVAAGYSEESKHTSGFVQGTIVESVELYGNGAYLRYLHPQLYDTKLFKRVPRVILNGTREMMSAFLRGYNCCDGLKGGRQTTEFKSFTTNSSVLALGLWYLVDRALGLRITIHPEFRQAKLYFHLNINSTNTTQKGKHLQKDIAEVKAVKRLDYSGWLFDVETDSGTFSAGVGLTWVHNSPRRGETFVTRKITRALAKIKLGIDEKLYLGNLDSKRDWGYAPDYVAAMWLMMQQAEPDDYVIATNETHTVREFVVTAGRCLDMDIAWKGQGVAEIGYDRSTGRDIIQIDPKYFRPTEVDLLMGDYTKAKTKLGWQPTVRFQQLVQIMAEADYTYFAKEKGHLAA